jgi:hypothetical protein
VECHVLRLTRPASWTCTHPEETEMSTDLDLPQYQALSFDCYGTLIDWEAGIAAVLRPWAGEQGLDLNDEELLLA